MATLADDNYSMPVAVALHSALNRLGPGWKPHLYVLSGGISDRNRERIEKVLKHASPSVDLKWCTPDTALIDKVPISTWHTRATLLRLYAPSVVPADAERVILMDSDVVVTGNLGELWGQSFDGHPLLAVENFFGSTLANGLPHHVHKLKLPAEAGYFNAGVFVADLPRWRSERVTERVFDFLAHNQVGFLEQDALNAVLAGDWALLHPRWNVQLAFLHTFGLDRYPEDVRRRLKTEIFAEPSLIHYVGPRKPWHWLYKGEKNEEFFRALGNSAWFPSSEFFFWAAAHRASHFIFRRLADAKKLVNRALGR